MLAIGKAERKRGVSWGNGNIATLTLPSEFSSSVIIITKHNYLFLHNIFIILRLAGCSLFPNPYKRVDSIKTWYPFN